MSQAPVSLGAVGERTAELEARLRAMEVLLEQVISTIPPGKREPLYAQAKQALLLYPQQVAATKAIDAIRMRVP